jgi:hypothetical protein
MIETSIYISYGVAGSIITTIVSSLCYFNRRKMCKKEIVLQAEEIIPETSGLSGPVAPVKLIFEVNNNDNEQWPIIN